MIVLVNDDGIDAPGFRLWYQALRTEFRRPVLAIAPSRERSGTSHAITLGRGLSVQSRYDRETDFFAFVVDGTPTDCCKLALKMIAPQTPKLFLSGINNGPNVGRSLFYSGTVGAAMEAAVEGFAAMAVSIDRSDHPPWQAAAHYAARLAKLFYGRASCKGVVANINLPVGPVAQWKPLQLVKHGLSGFEERYSLHQRGEQPTWHLNGRRMELASEVLTDAHALRAGHPTLSLLRPDINASDQLSADLRQRLMRVAPR